MPGSPIADTIHAIDSTQDPRNWDVAENAINSERNKLKPHQKISSYALPSYHSKRGYFMGCAHETENIVR